MKPLLDGDLICYEVAATCQGIDENGEVFAMSFEHVRERVDKVIAQICYNAGGTEPPLIYLTGKGNFREEIAKRKAYKKGRPEEKPLHYKNIKGYLIHEYGAIVVDGMEADDALCIHQMTNAKEYGVAIPIHGGRSVLVDYEDWIKYQDVTFITTTAGYVVNDTGKGETRKVWSLHRAILGDPDGVVDHINGDRLDNRKYNLRVCSVKENVRNSSSNIGTSKFKGVHWNKERNKWLASIKVDHVTKHLGRFDVEEEAAKAYDDAARIYFGEYARLNLSPPHVKPFIETIICSRDKDLKQCPFWHFSWECGKQPSIGPLFVEGYGNLDLKNGKKLVGTGNAWFFAQCLMGDTTDTIPGIKGYGPVKTYNVLKDTTTYREGQEVVINCYKEAYGDDWEKELLEQARLVWMVRDVNEDGSPMMWEITEYD